MASLRKKSLRSSDFPRNFLQKLAGKELEPTGPENLNQGQQHTKGKRPILTHLFCDLLMRSVFTVDLLIGEEPDGEQSSPPTRSQNAIAYQEFEGFDSAWQVKPSPSLCCAIYISGIGAGFKRGGHVLRISPDTDKAT